jgi:hypothetical protein
MRSDHSERSQRIISDYLQPASRRLRRAAHTWTGQLARGHRSRALAGRDPRQSGQGQDQVATFQNGDRAIAMRRRHYSDKETRAELERGWELEQLGWRARDLGHELVTWIRSGNESVNFCRRCDARIYVHTGSEALLPNLASVAAKSQLCCFTRSSSLASAPVVVQAERATARFRGRGDRLPVVRIAQRGGRRGSGPRGRARSRNRGKAGPSS